MYEIRYFPLVDMADDGSVKFPMFMAKDEQTLRSRNKPYISEVVPRVFRLHTTAALPENTDFRCPYCGSTLSRINPGSESRYALFECGRCRK